MEELLGDNGADLLSFDHLMDLFKAGPLDIIGLAGEQDDLRQRRFPFQTVVIIKGILIPDGAQEFELLLPCPDAGLFKQFPGDGLPAVLSCLGGTAGILPCAGETFPFGTAGQQDIAFAVIDPNADYKAVFSFTPGAAPAVNTAGKIALRVINIVKFHGFAFFLVTV